MPIYAPTLPPRPDLTQGSHPVGVLMRAELRRTVKNKIGMFFVFAWVGILLIRLAVLYVKHLMETKAELAMAKPLADKFLASGASFQAAQLDNWLLVLLWFLTALIGGALISRDSLYRIRPLIYAHPVEPVDYLSAKGLYGILVPFALMLPFVVLPWAMSLLMVGTSGPIWLSTPLRLLPAAGAIAFLMGSVAIGTSSLASTPRAGVAWMLGVYLGSLALGALMEGVFKLPPVLSLYNLSGAWPQLFCGVKDPLLTWPQATLGTLAYAGFSLFLAWTRTRPSEATV